MDPTTQTSHPAPEETFVIPAVNISETDDAVLLEAEMPGVDRTRLEVTLRDGELEIIGRRCPNGDLSGVVWQEIPRANYRRVFRLGEQVDPARIRASFQNGILSLKLGKAEEAKPHQIEVEFN